MANTGFIIHPKVVQVFTSGPNSGSEVSSSFNRTFDTGSGFTSASLCDNDYAYRIEDLENCPVTGSCPVPVYTTITKSDCTNSNSLTYGGSIPSSTEATTLFVQYSTTSNFSSNVFTFSRSASINGAFAVDLEIGLPNPPINNSTRIYSRAYYDCNGSTGDFSPTISFQCPAPSEPATIRAGFPSSTSCFTCVGVTVRIPRNSSRNVRITKSGIAQYGTAFCSGVNPVGVDINETITSNKTYTIGLDAAEGSNNTFVSRITVQVRDGNTVEDTYVLTRIHTNNFC